MKNLIKLVNIDKIYNTGKVNVHVLKNINLEINKNDYISIVGASGSGKTTLMNIIGCLDRATSGKYFFESKEISTFSDKELSRIRAEKIGFVFQSFNLLHNYNVLENVLMPTLYNKKIRKKEALKRAENLIELVGLSDRIKHKPNELSGGQQQRVAIARALINNPEIILADEPTGNLDSKSSDAILTLFEKLKENGVTLIIVTHEKAIADKTEKKITIKDGSLLKLKINSKKQAF